MALTSQITSYNQNWPSDFENEVARLRLFFKTALFDIHHVGSTAVPDLAAKPEIDILAVTDHDSKEIDWSIRLATIGYKRGSDLSDGHQFYKRDLNGIRTHKLHVCVKGHPEIARMLTFRNLLRHDAPLRNEYQALKRRLEQSNIHGIGEYLAQKAPFIENTLNGVLNTR